MSFYSLNRAALNAGVSGIVFGAALLVSSGALSGEATRYVLPDAAFVASTALSADGRLALQGQADAQLNGTVTATGVRTTPGDGGFIASSTCTAFPALLQLQSANIVVASALRATYTDAWAISLGSVSADGFITQPGTGVSAAVSTLWADPVATVGFSSNIVVASSASADASVKLSGQSTWQRDGYAGAVRSVSTLSADALRTGTGAALMSSTSTATCSGIKTHGGAAHMDGVFSVSVIASTDAALITSYSYGVATGLVTQFGTAAYPCLWATEATPTLTTFGAADVTASSGGTSTARLAELGLADIAATWSTSADSRTALQGAALINLASNATASATKTVFSGAVVVANSDTTAQWSVLRMAQSNIEALSFLTAVPYTNAEAPDPERRTMRRPGITRQMRRAA